MIGLDIKTELEELIDNIGKRNGYYGNKISPSVMRMFEVETRDNGAGILVPYWIGVMQTGRGPRRGTKDYGLVKIIYRWMQKHNMFQSATPKGKMNEAKYMTWYINKYGNAHFRSKIFVDVYKTERDKTIKKIEEKVGLLINKITMDVI